MISLKDKIENLSIPEQFDARGNSITLSGDFDGARNDADHQRRQVDALNMSGLADNAGLIQSNVGAIRSDNIRVLKEKEDKRKVQQAALDAARRIAEIDAELDKLYKIGEEIDQDIKDTTDRIKVLDDAIADPASIEIDADGNIKDPKIAQAVGDYKKRTGKDVDVTDMADLQAVLIAQRAHEADVLSGHNQRKHDNDTKIGDLEEEREQIKSATYEASQAVDADQVEQQTSRVAQLTQTKDVDIEVETLEAEARLSTEADDGLEDDGWFDDYDYESYADEVMPDETKVADVNEAERVAPKCEPTNAGQIVQPSDPMMPSAG